jgi:hypothetical protein
MIKIGSSIRLKVILLIAGALGLSAVSTVILGTQLILQDKTSYIYDYSASQIDALSAKLSTTYSPFTQLHLWPNNFNLNQNLEVFSAALGVRHIPHQNPPKLPSSQNFQFQISNDKKNIQMWARLPNSSYELFEGHELTEELKSISKEFSICILLPKSQQVLRALERDNLKKVSGCDELKDLVQTNYQKGAQEVTLHHEKFIVSYETIIQGSLTLLSVIPSDVAFQSAKTLIRRSSVLELSLFFLIVGFSILLIRTVISRINELTHATESVSSGNFDLQLSSLQSNDEVGLLANSFTLMSKKIKELLHQTEQKVRMEKELETAQLIQQKFLPQGTFTDQNITIHGISKAASECGGDFWQQASLKNRVIFLFGDITGHGVSSALLTAAAYGAFQSTTLQLLEQEKLSAISPETTLKAYGSSIHHAIESIAKKESVFQCILVLFDRETQALYQMNSAHPAPYIREAVDGKWRSLQAPPANALGDTDWVQNEVLKYELKSDATLFFYTDGVYDHRKSDDQKIHKKEVLHLLSTHSESKELPNLVMNYALDFFAGDSSNRPDDMTFVQIDWKSRPE